MEYLIGLLVLALGAVAAWGYSQKRGRNQDRLDSLRVEDAKLREGRDARARERKAVEAEAKRAETQAAAADADAGDKVDRLRALDKKYPAAFLALALGWGMAHASDPCPPPKLDGLQRALLAEGSELAADAAGGLKDAVGAIEDLCRERDHLRASRDLHARLAGIGAADTKAAMDALAVYRAEVPRLTARRFGWTAGIGAGLQADADEVEVGAFVGLMWGIRL